MTDSTPAQTILLIDDVPENLHLLSTMLKNKGYTVRSARSGFDALDYLRSEIPDLILLDIKMPQMGGFEVCRRLKTDPSTSSIPIIFISALGDIKDKIMAFESGGVDYITKPFQSEEVLARVGTHLKITRIQKELEVVNHAIEAKVKQRTAELEALKKQLEEENVYLQEELKTRQDFTELIGKNSNFKETLKLVKQVAPSNTTVLILGETGTGKELIARAIHEHSARSDRPLVKVNCAALPANLIESELFGHEKGAFTGALSRKIGRFELANKATIFLDEIGDLPMNLQSKLLRVLQDATFERIGNANTLKTDVRVIAATNRDLEELRKKELFRNDLFFRLNVFPIVCVPLRERKDDISSLTRHFIKIFNAKMGKNITKISQHNFDILNTYDWPGNVRELENVIERSMVLSSGQQLRRIDWLRNTASSATKPSIPTLDQLQAQHILSVLELTNGKIGGENGAAQILGLKRTTLQARMDKLGIKVTKTMSRKMDEL